MCQGTSAGGGKASPGPAEFVSSARAGREMGKTFYMAVQGREVTAEAARAVVKHPLPISTCEIGSPYLYYVKQELFSWGRSLPAGHSRACSDSRLLQRRVARVRGEPRTVP